MKHLYRAASLLMAFLIVTGSSATAGLKRNSDALLYRNSAVLPVAAMELDKKIYTKEEIEGMTKKKAQKQEPKKVNRSYTVNVKQKQKENPDTVGWLRVPGTTINTPVVFTKNSRNTYYLNNNFYHQPDKNGAYFADYRSEFGDGTRQDLGRNTVIYGHSWDDNPNAEMFSQLKKYRYEDFARRHPYLYFTTDTEEMVFEVFAVLDTHVNFPYVHSQPTQGYTVKSMTQAMMNSSLYHYPEVKVTTNDKVLTLSTCTYTVEGKPYQPADTQYRFVVVGRLVPEGEPLKKEANIVVNPKPHHPDTYSEIRTVPED